MSPSLPQCRHLYTPNKARDKSASQQHQRRPSPPQLRRSGAASQNGPRLEARDQTFTNDLAERGTLGARMQPPAVDHEQTAISGRSRRFHESIQRLQGPSPVEAVQVHLGLTGHAAVAQFAPDPAVDSIGSGAPGFAIFLDGIGESTGSPTDRRSRRWRPRRSVRGRQPRPEPGNPTSQPPGAPNGLRERGGLVTGSRRLRIGIVARHPDGSA